jgi:hyperosmotically inducible periplasmic protein
MESTIMKALLFRPLLASVALVCTPVTMASARNAAFVAGSRHANHQLERNVRRAIFRARVDTSDISILARNGKVTLIGGVPDQGMVQAAGNAAVQVAGVLSVDNELIRRPEGY